MSHDRCAPAGADAPRFLKSTRPSIAGMTLVPKYTSAGRTPSPPSFRSYSSMTCARIALITYAAKYRPGLPSPLIAWIVSSSSSRQRSSLKFRRSTEKQKTKAKTKNRATHQAYGPWPKGRYSRDVVVAWSLSASSSAAAAWCMRA